MMTWNARQPGYRPEMLGYLPNMLSDTDLRPAREQLATNYCGGWNPLSGFKMLPDGRLTYPGDPPMPILVETKLRDEIIRVYNSDWVAVIQPDGSFEVARLD